MASCSSLLLGEPDNIVTRGQLSFALTSSQGFQCRRHWTKEFACSSPKFCSISACPLAAYATGFWDSPQAATCVVKLDEGISCIKP